MTLGRARGIKSGYRRRPFPVGLHASLAGLDLRNPYLRVGKKVDAPGFELRIVEFHPACGRAPAFNIFRWNPADVERDGASSRPRFQHHGPNIVKRIRFGTDHRGVAQRHEVFAQCIEKACAERQKRCLPCPGEKLGGIPHPIVFHATQRGSGIKRQFDTAAGYGILQVRSFPAAYTCGKHNGPGADFQGLSAPDKEAHCPGYGGAILDEPRYHHAAHTANLQIGKGGQQLSAHVPAAFAQWSGSGQLDMFQAPLGNGMVAAVSAAGKGVPHSLIIMEAFPRLPERCQGFRLVA